MALIIEIVLAVLLSTAIGYGFILNRRIVELRKDQENLDKLAKSFSKATSRAEASIFQLKSTSDTTSQALDKTVKHAHNIREDLLYLIERGNKLADILESDIRREETRVSPADIPDKIQSKAISTKVLESHAKSEAEQELIRALRAVR